LVIGTGLENQKLSESTKTNQQDFSLPHTYFIEHFSYMTKKPQNKVEIKREIKPELQHEQIKWGTNPSCG
jgi:hypothetical protein